MKCLSVFVLSMCGGSHAVRRGQQWRQQQGEDWRRGRREGQRWHGVWCGALPVQAHWESPAALPSPPSRFYASKSEFISHTHIQHVSFSGCLMELNSHSSCSAASISDRERFWIVCVLCICVAEYVHAPSDWLQGLQVWARNTIVFAHLSLEQPLFLVSSACSSVSHPIPHRELYLLFSYSCRPSLFLLLWSLQHLH